MLRHLAIGACLALAMLAGSCAAEVGEKDAEGVHVLDHSTFQDTIQSKKVVVVYFYAKWSDKCTKFSANWTKIVKDTADLDNVAFGSLDVDSSMSMAEKYRVASYPGIVTFREGVEYPYDSSDFSVEALVKSVRHFASDSWTKPHMYSDHLTSADFEDVVKKGDGVLIKFYARWCGHCRAMGEEWDKAARACRKLDPPMKMYQIDCEDQKDLCSENKVDGYPTLRFYRDGRIIESYNGNRKKEDFMDYLRRKTGPPSKKLDATEKRLNEHIEALHKRGQPAIIGFFPNEEEETFDLYEMVARELRDKMELVHVVSETLGKKYGIDGKYGVYLSHPEHLRSKYEEAVLTLVGFSADDKDGLKNWIFTSSRPLVGHLTEHNTGIENIYWDIGVVTFYYTVDFGPEMIKSTQYWRNKFVEIAKDYRQHTNLTFAVADDEAYGGVLHSIGLSEHAFDVSMAITGPMGKQHFPIEEDWDEDLFRDHIDKYLAGTLPIYSKSEPVPANNKGPVKIAVGRNFPDLFDNQNKHAIVFFYMPWCGHCRTFDPIFLKVARKYKNNNDIVFMKFNMMENDTPPRFMGKIDGYPTTYFRARGGDETKKYEGGPDIDTLTKYVEANMKLSAKDEL